MTAIAATDLLPIVATTEAARGSLVVSVHDVAPATADECRHIVEELAKHGIRQTSLLVVPDYHRKGKTAADAKFVRWLRELETDGHEIVIHGYFHQRQARVGETMRDALITRVYTQSEGEFYDIDYAEALSRITAAHREFREAGLTPRGFIAPAWLLSEAGEAAARDAEMEYTTRLRGVQDLRTGANFEARSLVYSTRTAARRSASLVWNGILGAAVRNRSLVRLSIHPPDVRSTPIWRQITRFASTFSDTHHATTYADWIAEQRVATSAPAL